MFKLKALLPYLILIMVCPWVQAASDFDHAAWDRLLASHVVAIDDGRATQVNYGAFKRQQSDLKAYLDRLSEVTESEFDRLPKPEQLAFLINAYNAWTVELILTEYPDLESIKDLGGLFSSPWKEEFIPLFGETVSLDTIEHDLIRGSGRYNDPRIHFAVNCASIGCPALRTEAYTGGQLEDQLQQQTRLFLSDRSRNRLAGDELKVSSIFNWYREDFEAGWRGADTLAGFLILYRESLELPAQAVEALRAGDLDIEFLDYDWSLNDTP